MNYYTNRPLLSSKNPHFQNEATIVGVQPVLWKWVLFAWKWKIISISKAEHLPSFWNRGPGELGNGLLVLRLEKKALCTCGLNIYMLFNLSVYSMKLDVKRNWSGVLIVLLWLPSNEQTQFVADCYRWF